MDGNRYINPYTDYGFKYLFGTEPNKELTVLCSELLGGTEEDRCAVSDLYHKDKKAFYDFLGALMTAYSKGYTRGVIEGLAEGRAECRAEGQAEEKKAVARKLKLKGIDIVTIVEATGLPEDIIEML